jgi:hypothetical protein
MQKHKRLIKKNNTNLQMVFILGKAQACESKLEDPKNQQKQN